MSVVESEADPASDSARGGTFRAMRVRNFRYFFYGNLISSLGSWMQATALGWTVLTELTAGDAGAMGIATALNFLPSILLIGVTGRVVDRLDRRRMLIVIEGMLAAISLVIGVLLILGRLTLPIMLCAAAAAGVAVAFEGPVRLAFLSDMVEGDTVVNAASLTSVQFNVARLTGPALAGVLIAVTGTGWVFIINAATFLALIAALAWMNVKELVPCRPDPEASRMRMAFGYVKRRSDLLLLFGIVFVSSAFAVQFPVYGAAMALEFHQPSWAFGMLNSCYAVGSLTGAVLVARQRTVSMRRIVGFTFVVSVTIGISAGMPIFWLYAGICAAVGYAIVTLMANANAYIQTHTDRSVRGRVGVIYLAFFTGGAPFGAPLIGWASNAWGPRGAVVLVGAAALASGLAGIGWFLMTARARRSGPADRVEPADPHAPDPTAAPANIPVMGAAYDARPAAAGESRGGRLKIPLQRARSAAGRRR
jgi:MFS family permease